MASLICEQGDMGLWDTPMSEKDQQRFLQEQQQKDEKSHKSFSNSKETKADE